MLSCAILQTMNICGNFSSPKDTSRTRERIFSMALIAIYISNNLDCIRNEGLDVV